MTQSIGLQQLLDMSALRNPGRVAIEEGNNTTITYQELAVLSDRLRDRLHYLGVGRGDRVGIYMHKSIDAVAAIFGILKIGAAYVPVDPNAPIARNAYILNDCSVKVIVGENRFTKELQEALTGENKPSMIGLEGVGGGASLHKTLIQLQVENPSLPTETIKSLATDLAYILYTSGSTGRPKGVMLSHKNAISFIDWCSETFNPSIEDRFSSHAPFHFDLSILDIYVPIKHGAALILVNEDIGKDPVRLAEFISKSRITCWYSTPSILSLLAQYGKLERYDFSALRIINFAGEVFPLKHLRMLKNLLPRPKYFNLYGPTETNVCTYYELPDHISNKQIRPFPIGKACSHYQIKVLNEQGQAVSEGEEGELCASGLGVMQGYWNLPERTASAYLVDQSGQRWYKTGDIVVEKPDGNYDYIGRRDRMVKKRGYRVELGEIEAALYSHPDVKEVAVIALSDEEKGVFIKAFVSFKSERVSSIIEMKRFCMEKLPPYMVPDLFAFLPILPKTSTDKIDYQKLKELT